MARKSRKNIPPVAEQHEKTNPVFDTAGYVRLSAVDRKHKGDSIANQQAIIAAFIDEQPDLVLREFYIDDGTTGMTFERDAFKRMLADAENGKINCIVCKDLSRLGRNALDTGYYIETYFPAHGLRFMAINDDYDSADENCISMIVTLKNIINENYALEIGRKIRDTKQMNIREGAYVGRVPPYGYLKSAEDNHKLVIDDEAAPVIRRIYEMASDGKTASKIARHLSDAGIMTPRKHFYEKGLVSEKEANSYHHWNVGIIYSILHNRVYCGDMVQGKHSTHSYESKKLPESEWIIVEDMHEAIISRELWDSIQRHWDANKRQKINPYNENIFKGKIFCAHCGRAMRRQRYTYCYGFACETRSMYGEDDCISVSINENELKESLLAALNKHLETFIDSSSVKQPVDNSELQNVRRELDRCKGFIKSLYESLSLGDIIADEYKDMKQSYDARLSELTEQESILWETAIRKEECRKATDSMKATHGITELSAVVIDAFIERIDIYDSSHFETTYRFKDEMQEA